MKIILGVTGSIAAYKSLDLTRDLVKKSHDVIVVLSKGAENFVLPKVFKYLGAKDVFSHGDDFSKQLDSKGILHIDLAKWCDSVVIAPMSASFLSKIVNGEAFDLLSSLLLALPEKKKQLYFPAMNTQMLSHPYTIENLKKLELLKSKFEVFIHPSTTGLLACGDNGEGKLPSIEEITEIIESFASSTNKRVLISTGATKAPLDNVRYLTNSSSGKTGYFLSKEALKLGHKVRVLAGEESKSLFTNFIHLPNFELNIFKTNSDLEELIEQYFPHTDCYISSAAIGDIKFNASLGKLKKDNIGESLSLIKTKDILKDLISKKRDDQQIIGFAAESELSKEILLKKLKSKPVDFLIGTKVNNGLTGQEKEGFEVLECDYLIFNKGNFNSKRLDKKELASYILKDLFN